MTHRHRLPGLPRRPESVLGLPAEAVVDAEREFFGGLAVSLRDLDE